MLYTDFIRKKMHNLSKIITASGYPLKTASKFNRKAVDYVIHGATVPGKNLIPYPYEDGTEIPSNGVTYTVNSDGSITLNGTVTGNQSQYFMMRAWSTTFTLPKGVYTLSGLTGGSQTTYFLQLSVMKDGSEIKFFRCCSEPVVIDLNEYDYDCIGLKILAYKDETFNNLTIYPMLNEGETAEEFEVYTEYSVGDTTKNLLTYPYDYGDGIVAGVEYSVNDDGSLNAKGTATSNAQFFFKKAWHNSNDDFILEGGKKYTLSGCVDGAESTYYLQAALINLTLDKEIARARCCTEPVILDLTEYKYNPGSSEATDYDLVAVKLYVAGGANIDKTIYPMINEGDTAAPFEPYSEYDYKITLKNAGKNLIPYPYAGFEGEKEVTINGMTFTDNGDGSIGVDGTAAADVRFTFTGDFVLPPEAFTISINHDNQDFYIGLNEREGNPNEDGNYVVYCDLIVYAGVTINNGICRPQIEYGETATNYEVYRTPELTTIYTNSQIKDGETMSYRADKLPELKLYKGENSITAETEVAPTSVDMRYYD